MKRPSMELKSLKTTSSQEEYKKPPPEGSGFPMDALRRLKWPRASLTETAWAHVFAGNPDTSEAASFFLHTGACPE